MPTLWLSDMQKIGVAFCSGGAFFFVAGIVLFFDRALLAMANMLFLLGITLLLGPTRTLAFFARRQKWRGTAAFFAGIALILLRWPLVGFAVQMYGIFSLFGEFFRLVAVWVYGVPVVGPWVARGLRSAGDRAGAGERAHKDLPV